MIFFIILHTGTFFFYLAALADVSHVKCMESLTFNLYHAFGGILGVFFMILFVLTIFFFFFSKAAVVTASSGGYSI